MLLEILIPTYNRAPYLEDNINQLMSHIRTLSLQEYVSILVSNNASQDDTDRIITKIINSNSDISIKGFSQTSNIGLEHNAVFCLSKSTANYSMFLGDDDYIDIHYLDTVVKEIKSSPQTTCIIPAIISIDMSGTEMRPLAGRDLDEKTTHYSKGVKSALTLFQKGHQLSGVTFLRVGTLEDYLDSGYRNIYLFMHLVGFNCLRGDALHLVDYPVKVTQPPQDKKDWNYGQDGLINERLKNCHSIFKKNKGAIFKAEKIILYLDRGFGYKYLKEGVTAFVKFVQINLFSKPLTFRGRVYFFAVSMIIFTKHYLRLSRWLHR